MNKQQDLNKIAKEIRNCKICPINKIGKAVPGEGNPDADVMFVGEAPGKTESKVGKPFIGRSGQLLRKMIREIGLKEADVFIGSPVKYLPVYGTPKKSDIEHGKTHLLKQIAIIQPKIIVLLGATAAKALIDGPVATLKEHGTTMRVGNGLKPFPTYFLTIHPAAAMRFPQLRKLFQEDFKKLKTLMHKEI